MTIEEGPVRGNSEVQRVPAGEPVVEAVRAGTLACGPYYCAGCFAVEDVPWRAGWDVGKKRYIIIFIIIAVLKRGTKASSPEHS